MVQVGSVVDIIPQRRIAKVVVAGVEVPQCQFLPDTGSDSDLITRSFLQSLGTPVEVSVCTEPLRGITADAVDCVGVCMLPVTVEGFTRIIRFHVLRAFSYDVVMSHSSMADWGFQLRTVDGVVMIPPNAMRESEVNGARANGRQGVFVTVKSKKADTGGSGGKKEGKKVRLEIGSRSRMDWKQWAGGGVDVQEACGTRGRVKQKG